MNHATRVMVGLGVAAGFGMAGPAARPLQPPDVIRVALQRVDGETRHTAIGFVFDPSRVAEVMARDPVRLPDPPTPGARVGFHPAADLFVLLDRATPESATLIIDANMNRDLTDDAAVQVGSAGDGVIVRVRRAYARSSPTAVWLLPYRFIYRPRTSPQGESTPGLAMSAAFEMEGSLRVGKDHYIIGLRDNRAMGRFDRHALSAGTAVSLRQSGEPRDRAAGFRGFELLALGGHLYAVRDLALDGSWVELERSSLPPAAIGRAVPDFRLTDSAGQAFTLRDYRGRYLLLDFWPSSCAPCVREFANIKKSLERHANELSVVGINLDPEQTVPVARTIIADHVLPWRQVIEGKGFFLPIYQVLGRLPEFRMAYPVYVAVAPDGVVAYACNDFSKMQRFLDTAFSDAGRRGDLIFVPLVDDVSLPLGEPRPVDFNGPALAALLADPAVKLPAGLPSDARVGRLPNNTLVITRPGETAGRVRLRVDEDGDRNLSSHVDAEIPVLTTAPDKAEALPSFQSRTSFEGGGAVNARIRFFARPPDGATPGGSPQVFYVGYRLSLTGAFVRDGVDYEVSIVDPSFDLVFSREDVLTPGFLTLRKREGGRWTSISTGVTDLPIGGRRFRVAHVQDDGRLVVLERQAEGPAHAR